MSIVPVSIPSPYTVFLDFLEGQKHKDSKLGVMVNMGKRSLVKFIFSNIHKIGDVCANSFGRYIMIAQGMRNVFTFYYIQVYLEKWCFWEIKANLPQHSQALEQLFSPHLFNHNQKAF